MGKEEIDSKEDLVPEKVNLITLLRTFKKEGLENFIVVRKVKFEKIVKENELAKQTLIKNCNIADERNELLKENNELKQALIINKNLYEEVCNKNKELEEENKKYIVKLTDEEYRRVIEAAQKDCIPKSLIKEKIEKYELYKKETNITLLRTTFESKIEVLQELLRRGEVR